MDEETEMDEEVDIHQINEEADVDHVDQPPPATSVVASPKYGLTNRRRERKIDDGVEAPGNLPNEAPGAHGPKYGLSNRQRDSKIDDGVEAPGNLSNETPGANDPKYGLSNRQRDRKIDDGVEAPGNLSNETTRTNGLKCGLRHGRADRQQGRTAMEGGPTATRNASVVPNRKVGLAAGRAERRGRTRHSEASPEQSEPEQVDPEGSEPEQEGRVPHHPVEVHSNDHDGQSSSHPGMITQAWLVESGAHLNTEAQQGEQPVEAELVVLNFWRSKQASLLLVFGILALVVGILVLSSLSAGGGSSTDAPTDCIGDSGTADEIYAAVNDFYTFGAASFYVTAYGPIEDWCFGAAITNMSALFKDKTLFNEDISRWDTSSVIDMSRMFEYADSFNGDLSGWDTSSVIDMIFMFADATSFNGDLSGWDTSSVIDMSWMFYNADSFNGDLSGWDTWNVTTMSEMFADATSFNGDLSGWDTSSVTDMRAMFYNATSFNGDLSGWDTWNVIDMSYMFYNATSFNGDLSGWDTSSVINMSFMFYDADSFNQSLCAWGNIISPSTSVTQMFYGASSCADTSDPNLSLETPGPFCQVCTSPNQP